MKKNRLWLVFAMSACLLLSEIACAEVEPMSSGNWLYQSLKDPVTDKTGALVMTVNLGDVSGFGFGCDVTSAARPIAFRFKPGKNKHLPYASTTVTIRVDQGAPYTSEWYVIRDTALLLDRRAMVKVNELMRSGSTMIVRARDSQGQPIDVEFTIEGAGAAVDRALQECGYTKGLR